MHTHCCRCRELRSTWHVAPVLAPQREIFGTPDHLRRNQGGQNEVQVWQRGQGQGAAASSNQQLFSAVRRLARRKQKQSGAHFPELARGARAPGRPACCALGGPVRLAWPTGPPRGRRERERSCEEQANQGEVFCWLLTPGSSGPLTTYAPTGPQCGLRFWLRKSPRSQKRTTTRGSMHTQGRGAIGGQGGHSAKCPVIGLVFSTISLFCATKRRSLPFS
jgi:hypothetical protein